MLNQFASLTTKSTNNLGDEIQILAAERFIKKHCVTTIDRERLSEYKGKKMNIILNGWYLHDLEFWPPSNQLNTLITSFHMTDLPNPRNGMITREAMTKKGKNLDFLKNNSPIGARDLETFRFLQKKEVVTYFSGCLTLTLKPKGLSRKNLICSVDLPEEVNEHIKKVSSSKIIYLENSKIPDNINYAQKLDLARKTLDTYEQSKLVITSRLHAALPSLALGTPVLLINNENIDASRYTGLRDLVKNCYAHEFLSGMYNECLNQPANNMEYHKVIAANLEIVVSNFINGNRSTIINFDDISSQNLLATFFAKEENEKYLHEHNRQNLNSYAEQNSSKRVPLINRLRERINKVKPS